MVGSNYAFVRIITILYVLFRAPLPRRVPNRAPPSVLSYANVAIDHTADAVPSLFLPSTTKRCIPPLHAPLCHHDSHPPRLPTAPAEMVCVSSCLVFSITRPRHYSPCCAGDYCPPHPRQSAVFGCGSCACRTRGSCQRSTWRCTVVQHCGGGACTKGGGVRSENVRARAKLTK